MIFVACGGGVLWKFDRLVRIMDELASETEEKTIIQKGCSSYTPKNAEFFDFVIIDRFIGLCREADIIVGHAGVGSALLARMCKKPFIAVPRNTALGEIFDDHQFELAEYLKKYDWVRVAHSKEEVRDAVTHFLKKPRQDIFFESGPKSVTVGKIKSIIGEWEYAGRG